MINVILVDDEPLMIKTLTKQVPWNKYNMNIVGTYSNPRKVLLTIKNQPVDIIFTDIKMPQIDGIELIQAVKKIDPSIIFIVLSSYSDFPLVKKAFKAGATDYILKIDIDSSTMQSLLYKLRETVIEINNKQPNFSLEKYCCDYLNLTPNDPTYICIIKNINYEDINIIEKKLKLCEKIYNFHWLLKDNCYIIVISYNKNSIHQLNHFSIIDILTTYFIKINIVSTNICIGISKLDKVKNINKLLNQATQACNMSYYDQYKHLFLYDNINHDKLPNKEYIKKHILNSINNFNIKNLIDTFELYFNQINQIKPTKNLIQTDLIDIFTYLIYHLSDINLLPNEMKYNYNYIQNKIDNFTYFKNIEKWIMIQLNNISKNFQIKKDKEITELVKIYIEQNFTQHLTLTKISKQFGINKSYLSRIFSQDIGICFKEYLNSLKINKAKNYLHNTDYTISEISHKIGFANVEHFSRTFKSMVGLSPSSYRTNIYKLNL